MSMKIALSVSYIVSVSLVTLSQALSASVWSKWICRRLLRTVADQLRGPGCLLGYRMMTEWWGQQTSTHHAIEISSASLIKDVVTARKHKQGVIFPESWENDPVISLWIYSIWQRRASVHD